MRRLFCNTDCWAKVGIRIHIIHMNCQHISVYWVAASWRFESRLTCELNFSLPILLVLTYGEFLTVSCFCCAILCFSHRNILLDTTYLASWLQGICCCGLLVQACYSIHSHGLMTTVHLTIFHLTYLCCALDLSQRVDSVKEENLKLKSENQVLGQYIENLMAASSVFQSTSPKAKKKLVNYEFFEDFCSAFYWRYAYGEWDQIANTHRI